MDECYKLFILAEAPNLGLTARVNEVVEDEATGTVLLILGQVAHDGIVRYPVAFLSSLCLGTL